MNKWERRDVVMQARKDATAEARRRREAEEVRDWAGVFTPDMSGLLGRWRLERELKRQRAAVESAEHKAALAKLPPKFEF